MSRPDGRVRIPVRVTPRAGRDGIDGVVDGHLRVRVAVAPIDGAANAAVERLIADALGIPPSSVATIRGATSRFKLMAITGVSPATIAARWPGLVV